MRQKRLISILGVLATLPFACSKGGSSNAPPAPIDTTPGRTDPASVHVDGRVFRDGTGRQLLFRGYNTKVNGIFDVSFDDGRIPNYTFVGLDETQAARIEALGFDVVRLPVSWSALEPHPLAYSEDFFAKVATLLDMAKRHHFYVIVDMHQDGYSKEIGEDGAPLWAIVPPPTTLLQGPSDDSRRLTGPVLAAGFSFFANDPATDGRPLQVAFVAAAQQIARRFGSDPSILGYEAFNEPVVLKQQQLDDFHAAFAAGIHAIDKDAPILFEPAGTRNQSDNAYVPADPWANGPGVYAPHIYTGQFSRPSQNGWESEDPAVLAPSMEAAVVEAAAWSTPLFVTEFGCDQSIPRGAKWLSAELDLQDRLLASSTAWAWDGGNWGFTDGKGNEWPATAKTMSRSYPRAVAGDLVAIEHPAAGHLLVRYRPTQKTRGLSHEVSASTAYATGYTFMCDGAPVDVTAAEGRASFVCPDAADGEHTFEVVGTPVP